MSFTGSSETLARPLGRALVLATLVGLAPSCSREVKSDLPRSGPSYNLSTEGAAEDVRQALLEMLQQRMKPVRLVLSDDMELLGTIHVKMRIFEKSFETSDRKEKAQVPINLKATMSVTTREGSSNWDGEHTIGFEVDGPHSFSDAAKTRRRFAKRLLEVAVKQLPGRGVFTHDSLTPARPAK